MAQGLDPDPLHQTVADPKTIGHGKVTKPNLKDRHQIEVYFLHMSMKIGRRLRKYGYEAQAFSIGALTDQGWLQQNYKTLNPLDDGALVNKLCTDFLETSWRGQGIFQVHIRATDPKAKLMQGDFFKETDPKKDRLNATIDKINMKYGEFAVCPALLLDRSDMPNVIAPSWKPYGHRETISY